jgi:hypothetical protein
MGTAVMGRSTPLGLAVGISCLLALGCSGAAAGDDLGSSEGAFREGDLAPAYAIELESKVVATYPSTGDKRFAYTTRLVGRVVTKRDAKDGIVLGIKPCSITLPPAGGFQPTVPDDAFSHVDDLQIRATIDDDKLTTRPAAMLLGVRGLEDPLKSPLPKSSDDKRVFDHDKDGQPGFSVYVSVGRVAVGMRVVASFTGTLRRAGEISGDAQVQVESEIYGDTIPFVDVKSRVESAEKAEVVSKKNTFRMTPLSGEATCEAAIAAASR